MPYIGVSPQFGVRRKHTYTATAGQTSFSGAGSEGATLSYKDSNFVDVYQNGVKLGDADYTSTSGTAIVLAQGASVDDLVEIIVFDAFSAADTVSKADGGTFDGAVTFSGGVSGDTTFTGDLTIPQKIIHSGDTDTHIALADNQIDLTAGNVNIFQGVSNEVVINQGSADVNFRVESNGNANMLVVDGGNDNVGIGGTGNPTLYVVNNSAGPGLTAANATAVFHGSVDTGKGGCIGFDFGASHTNYPVGIGYIITSQTASTTGDLGFFTRSGTGDDAPSERMRIASNGEVAIGNTDTSDATPTLGFQVAINTTGTYVNIGHSTNAGNGFGYVRFVYDGTIIGQVAQNGTTGVTYLTSSDYRLKENVVTDWDATSRLKQLKPSRFNFIGEPKVTVDGFLAHEVSDIVPEAISGEKDGTEDIGTIKDEDGNVIDTDAPKAKAKEKETWTKTGTKNAYQGIDQSKLVPLLTKTLQEALTRIDTLEAEVKALKGE